MSPREHGTGGAEHLRTQAEKEARDAADEVYRGDPGARPRARDRPVVRPRRSPSWSCWATRRRRTASCTSRAPTARRRPRAWSSGWSASTACAPAGSPARTCRASTERIVIDGEPISDERFVEVWQDVAPYVHLVDQRSARGGQAAAVVLRGVHGDGVRGVRGRPGGRRGDRGRHGRAVGLHQRRRRRGRDHHADLDGPRAVPRRHAARHRVGQGGDRQGRRDARPGRASRRTSRASCWPAAAEKGARVRARGRRHRGRRAAGGGGRPADHAADARRHVHRRSSCRCTASSRRTTPCSR